MKEISTMRISDAITWFLEYHQNTKKFSPKTVEVYNHAFEVFLSYVNSRTMIKNITTEDILSFQKTVSETKKISVGTLNKYSSALRSLFRFFNKNGAMLLPPEAIPLTTVTSQKKRYLLIDEIHDIATYLYNSDRHGVRNKAMAILLYATGMRITELCTITLIDIRIEDREISIIGKRNKRRIVFFSLEAYVVLKEYLALRGNEAGYLFCSTCGKEYHYSVALRRETVYRIINSAAKELKIKKDVTPHIFRHTFASHLLRQGADIRSVQLMLGHSSIQTTQIYTQMTDFHLKKVYTEFF